MNDEPSKPALESLSILVTWRKFIIVNYIVAIAISGITAFILPKWFRATASILPPKDQLLQSALGGSSSLLRGLTSGRLGSLGQSSATYNYLAILNSRSTMEDVVKKFDLVESYDLPKNSIERAIKELRDNASFESQDNENIDIEVLDKDPQRASEMANYFVEILNRRSIELGTAEARSNRTFIEGRMNEVKDSLRTAEDRLKSYQEKSGLVITSEESAGMKALADLYAVKTKKEIEMAILAKTVAPDNELMMQNRLELDQLTQKLAKIPDMGLKSLRLYRDAITYQRMLEILLPMYEQAKINEQKDIPTLLVLDKAVPPEQKAKPQRALIILSITTLWLMLSVVLVYLFHGIYRRKNELSVNMRKLSDGVQRIAKIYHVSID